MTSFRFKVLKIQDWKAMEHSGAGKTTGPGEKAKRRKAVVLRTVQQLFVRSYRFSSPAVCFVILPVPQFPSSVPAPLAVAGAMTAAVTNG